MYVREFYFPIEIQLKKVCGREIFYTTSIGLCNMNWKYISVFEIIIVYFEKYCQTVFKKITKSNNLNKFNNSSYTKSILITAYYQQSLFWYYPKNI